METQEPPPAVVSKARFGLFTSDEVERLSAVEVSSKIINRSGVVNSKGVNDARMGTVLRSMICLTCKNTMKDCPGHSGHIRLNQPCVNVEFLSIVHKVLTCVCFYCCRLLLPKDSAKLKKIRAIKDKKTRLDKIYAYCKIHRICPTEQTSEAIEDLRSSGCGGSQPTYYIDGVLIRARKTEEPVSPENVMEILRFITAENKALLGFESTEPEGMVWHNFLVPPVSMRPSRSKANSTKINGEDDLTMRLRQIVKLNAALGEQEINLAGPDEDLEQYLELAREIAAYQNSKYQPVNDSSEYGRDKKCVRDRFVALKAKKGRIRNSILGKRMDFSARTVITPDNYMELIEVGVPIWMCKVLTYPERVAPFNVHRLTRLVRNGPDVYPGANYIVGANGEQTTLNFADRYTLRLQYGQTVMRHLIAGDWVLFNRQPSLHKMSMMAHRVRPMKGNSFRLHVACTAPYNADYDGDEMNLLVLRDQKTRAEAREIMAVDQNMVKDSVPLVTFQQHSVAAAYLLTADGETMPRSLACQLLAQNKFLQLNRVPEGSRLTGKQVFQACLPADFYFCHDRVSIKAGVFLTGQLEKKSLKALVHAVWKDQGGRFAARFISGTQLMLESYLMIKGLSLGVDDCLFTVPDSVKETVRKAIQYVDAMDHQPSDRSKAGSVREENVCLVLDKARDVLGNYLTKQMNGSRNGLLEMVSSGAKGNPTNIIQNAGMVGQQRNYQCSRIPITTSHFNARATAEGNGMITRSFMRGLRPNEYFSHLIASRGGLVDTSVKTSDTGYCQRKISKAMEDVVVQQDRAVRNSHGDVVQFLYGDDGFDATYVERSRIRFLTDKPNGVWQTKLRSKLLQTMTEFDNTCLCPVNFDRLLARAQALPGPMVEMPPQRIWNTLVSRGLVRPVLKTECLFADRLPRRLSGAGWKLYVKNLERILLTKSTTPNESVGICAAQNCSEPLTQMTLNTFHKSGQVSHLLSGVARIKEILNFVKNPAMPSMTVVPAGVRAEDLGLEIVQILAADVVDHWDSVVPDPERVDRFESCWTKWDDVARLVVHMNKEKSHRLQVSPLLLANALRKSDLRKKSKTFVQSLSFSAGDDDWWVCLSVERGGPLWSLAKSDREEMVLLYLYEKLVAEVLVRGIRGIHDFYLDDKELMVDGDRCKKRVVVTRGSNLGAVLGRPDVDARFTSSNVIGDIEQTLGIDAAQECIEEELRSVMSINKAHVSGRHIKLIASVMCYRGVISPMTNSGICHQNTSVLKKAAFEKPMYWFMWGALHGHTDDLTTATECIAWNAPLRCGTGTVSTTEKPVQGVEQALGNRRVVYEPPTVKEFLVPKTQLTKRKAPALPVPARKKQRIEFEPFVPSSPSHPVVCFEGFIPSSPIVSK